MRYNTETISKIIYEKYGTKVLSSWEGTTTKMKIKCLCGEVFLKTWDDINKTDTGICKNCSSEKELARRLENKKKEIRGFFESRGWTLHNEYEGYKTVLYVSRNDINQKGTFNSLKYRDIFNDGCVVVNNRNDKIKRIEEYLSQYEVKTVGEISNENEINCICSCGSPFKINLHNFKLKKHKGCNICSSRRRMEVDEVKTLIEDRGFKFISIDDKKNVIFTNETMVEFRRNLKDIIYEDINNNTYMKTRSKGESYISEYLNSCGFSFEVEKTFSDLRTPSGGTPRFDFYLPNSKTVIEFHGRQHFEPHWDYATGINLLISLRNTMVNDSLKEEYCKNQGIRIIYINYYEIKYIKEILDAVL